MGQASEKAAFSLEYSHLIGLAIAAVLAFYTFKGETKDVQSDTRVEISEIKRDVDYNREILMDVKEMLKEPRFSPADFVQVHRPYETRLNRVEVSLENRVDFMDSSKEADRDAIEFKRRQLEVNKDFEKEFKDEVEKFRDVEARLRILEEGR